MNSTPPIRVALLLGSLLGAWGLLRAPAAHAGFKCSQLPCVVPGMVRFDQLKLFPKQSVDYDGKEEEWNQYCAPTAAAMVTFAAIENRTPCKGQDGTFTTQLPKDLEAAYEACKKAFQVTNPKDAKCDLQLFSQRMNTSATAGTEFHPSSVVKGTGAGVAGLGGTLVPMAPKATPKVGGGFTSTRYPKDFGPELLFKLMSGKGVTGMTPPSVQDACTAEKQVPGQLVALVTSGVAIRDNFQEWREHHKLPESAVLFKFYGFGHVFAVQGIHEVTASSGEKIQVLRVFDPWLGVAKTMQVLKYSQPKAAIVDSVYMTQFGKEIASIGCPGTCVALPEKCPYPVSKCQKLFFSSPAQPLYVLLPMADVETNLANLKQDLMPTESPTVSMMRARLDWKAGFARHAYLVEGFTTIWAY